MQLPYSDQLNIAALSRLFDNKSECYKLFWFQAILGEVCSGNLHPTTRSINSSKSNNLPDWEHYFPLLADLEYHSYRMIWTYDKVKAEFQKCAREHLNSPEIEHRLYRPGLDQKEFKLQLSEVIYPVYQSAKNCGFRKWEYSHE